MKMKALSVRQPWAQMIAWGNKTIECRSWPTKYRGELLICASAYNFREDEMTPEAYEDVAALAPNNAYILGGAVAVAKVVDCRPFRPEDREAAWMMDWSEDELEGLYAWCLEDIRPIEPIDVKGKQRLFDVELEEEIEYLDIPGYTDRYNKH